MVLSWEVKPIIGDRVVEVLSSGVVDGGSYKLLSSAVDGGSFKSYNQVLWTVGRAEVITGM